MGNLDILKKSFITSTTGECESCLVLKQEGESSSVWPNLAKFRHHGKIFQTFDKCMTVHFFGKMLKHQHKLHYFYNFFVWFEKKIKAKKFILLIILWDIFYWMQQRKHKVKHKRTTYTSIKYHVKKKKKIDQGKKFS